MRTEFFARAANDDGGAYTMELRPKLAAQYMVAYRDDLKELSAELANATALIENDEQRAAIADIHKALDGPHRYLQGNQKAFALKAAGKTKEASLSFLDTSAAPVFDAAQKYRTNIKALAESATLEVERLSAFAKNLGIGLAVAALILGFVIATLISRSISRSVGAATLAVGEIVSEDIASSRLSIAGALQLGSGLTSSRRTRSRHPPACAAGSSWIWTSAVCPSPPVSSKSNSNRIRWNGWRS